MIAMKLYELLTKSLFSTMVLATIGICIFGADVTEARYLPTRGKSDGLDRLRDLLRDVSVFLLCSVYKELEKRLNGSLVFSSVAILFIQTSPL